MVWPQLAEDNVEGDRPRALAGQLLGEAAINVAGPIQSRPETERSICPDKIDAGFVDSNEAEVTGDGRRKLQRFAGAHVVGDAFQVLDKINAKQTHGANEDDHAERDQDRNAFDRF